MATLIPTNDKYALTRATIIGLAGTLGVKLEAKASWATENKAMTTSLIRFELLSLIADVRRKKEKYEPKDLWSPTPERLYRLLLMTKTALAIAERELVYEPQPYTDQAMQRALEAGNDFLTSRIARSNLIAFRTGKAWKTYRGLTERVRPLMRSLGLGTQRRLTVNHG